MAVSEESIISIPKSEEVSDLIDEINFSSGFSEQKVSLEKLLDLVEELKKSYELTIRRIAVIRYLQATIFLLFLSLLIYGYNNSVNSERSAISNLLEKNQEDLKYLNGRKNDLQDRLNYEIGGKSSGISGEGALATSIKRQISEIQEQIDSDLQTDKLLNEKYQSLEPSLFKFVQKDASFFPIFVITVFALLLLSFLKRNYRQTFLSDQSALSNGLQILRETFDAITTSENWSVLSRAEFRIRLSRFDLGKYESKFNFFS